MAVTKIGINEFLLLSQKHPVLDVRSPGEFSHAHVPGATSSPLFTDEERKVVGTAYKKQGRQPAIKIGMKYFGPKMVAMVEEATAISAGFYNENKEAPELIVHCWRGGMRSAAIAWLLDIYGFKVYTLAGGYKAFRNWALKQFEKRYSITIIGGYTGSNKTALLQQLQNTNESVIDLETLAQHKGSAFGALGMQKQPSQEMFENKLAVALWKTTSENNNTFFIEDESRAIGLVNIPTAFFNQLRTSPVLFLDIPFEERLNLIVQEYGVFGKTELADAILRIQKRLGGLETKNALAFLQEDNIAECFRILLGYYDKWYRKGLGLRAAGTVTNFKLPSNNAATNAALLLQKLRMEI